MDAEFARFLYATATCQRRPARDCSDGHRLTVVLSHAKRMHTDQTARLLRLTGTLAIAIACLVPVGVYLVVPQGPTMKAGRKAITVALARHGASTELKAGVNQGADSFERAADQMVSTEYRIWVILWASLCMAGMVNLYLGSTLAPKGQPTDTVHDGQSRHSSSGR